MFSLKYETSQCGWNVGNPLTENYSAAFYQWNTFSFTYGNIAYRAAFPSATPHGGYAAIWLLGVSNGGTPNCQLLIKTNQPTTADCLPGSQGGYAEIDLSEILGSTSSVSQQIHVPSGTYGGSIGIADNTQFHNYEVDWSAGHVTWYVDGGVTSSVTRADVPGVPMFLNLQTAVWQFNTPDPSFYPSTMSVDYVRVCPTSTTPGNCTQGNATIFDEEFGGTGPQADVYVAQGFQGNATGLSCTDSFGLFNGVNPSSVNDVDYWTAGIIGPGTTIHLCGAITIQPTAFGSGTSGNPVTFRLESGASSPRINLNGQSNIACIPANLCATGVQSNGPITVSGGVSIN